MGHIICEIHTNIHCNYIFTISEGLLMLAITDCFYMNITMQYIYEWGNMDIKDENHLSIEIPYNNLMVTEYKNLNLLNIGLRLVFTIHHFSLFFRNDVVFDMMDLLVSTTPFFIYNT
ncbi:hypothetical protein ACJX0J_038005 [Zea mays]